MKNKEFAAVLLCLLIIGATLFLRFRNDYERWQYKTVAPPLFPTCSIKELRTAQHYHGIKCATQQEDGTWIFERDGKICKLFTYKRKEK